MALISSGGRYFWRFAQPTFFWAGRPTSGGLSVLRCSDTFLSGHGSILDRVDVAYLTMAQVGFSFGYGSKPSGSKLCTSGFSPLKCLGFSLYVTLVKSHAKIPPKVCRSAGFGPSGPNSIRFGSNLDMSSLRSNKHQNLWNSLVVMVMAWIRPTFHEIRRSVGGENHRYRPPTTIHFSILTHGSEDSSSVLCPVQ